MAENEEPLTVELSPLVVLLLFAAIGYAEDTNNWTGAGLELTPEELDEIDALSAQAALELTGV